MGGTDDKADIGRHLLRFEPPDLVISAPVGALSLAEANEVWAFLVRKTKGLTTFYWIADISKMVRFSNGSTQSTPKELVPKLRAFAIVGGTFRQRTMVSLVLRASRLLGNWSSDFRAEFFADEPSARTWIEGLRAEPRK